MSLPTPPRVRGGWKNRITRALAHGDHVATAGHALHVYLSGCRIACGSRPFACNVARRTNDVG